MLPFDNLTADPALDWIASAAPAIVAEQLTGAAAVFPLRAQTLGEAYAERATQFVHGYFDHRGAALHFELTIEDASRHKMVRSAVVKGNLVPAMNTFARIIDPTAHSFSTSNPESVAAWGQGDYQRAVSLDPDFSGAWLDWVQARMGAGDTAGALKIAKEALARIPPGSSAIDRAHLELLGATLGRDENAREEDLRTLARLLPNDPSIPRTLADLEMNARRFPQAVKLYQDLLRIDPDEVSTFNLLGYAQAFAGDLNAARKSLEQYGRELDQEANSLDSLGEAMFLHGRFADAEKYFLEAHEKNGAMLSGGDLLKAAYARWLAGDLPQADVLFAQYRAYRAGLGDSMLFWREAVWEYSTGRTAAAIAGLQSASGQSADLAKAQLAMWGDPERVPHDSAALKQLYERTPPSSDGLIRTLYAAALLESGQKEEARKLVELWPLPDAAGDDLLRAFLYPKFLELRQQLKS
ncbi:MAG: tetratricopeptide repeat protein [Bryobacteraceae bacterium]